MTGFRCKDCGHAPRRQVTATSKKGAEPKQHKKACYCECHIVTEVTP